MKTRFFLAGIFSLALLSMNAQVTIGLNTVLSASSYVGTANDFDVVFKRRAVPAGVLATTTTAFGVNANSMPNSASFGLNAGQYSSGAGGNTYLGNNAGKGQSATVLNSGTGNTFVGAGSGSNNTSGSGNVAIGSAAGSTNTAGSSNVYIGKGAGFETDNDASGNVFIGFNAGFTEDGSNKLVIGNSESKQLIWGDFATDQLKLNGKVGIGGVTTFPTATAGINLASYKLFVKGGLLADEVRVSTTWADYVFAKGYQLPTLAEVEDHIKTKGHLINVPSAAQIEAEGIEVGQMAKIQQEKIEELTLYLIEQHKTNEKQSLLIEQLTQRLSNLEKK